MRKNIVIVGGVAAGSSCATRARRLNEEAAITIVERGPFVSFANCGLPYHVGNVIEDVEDLLLVSPETFSARYDIKVLTQHEVIDIDRQAKRVELLDRCSGAARWLPYDQLLLSTGAGAFAPPIEGLDSPGVFTLRTIPDSRHVRAWIEEHNVRRALVIGAGFIGLETAENLRRRGLEVHVVEFQDQVLPTLDDETARIVAAHLQEHDLRLHLDTSVERVEPLADGSLMVTGSGGLAVATDLVIAAVGVRPRSDLAERAGLELGPRGGIRVDSGMRSSDPDIFAAGDVIETVNCVSGQASYLPLAGPANRQGRVAADVMMGKDRQFRGVQGTVICGLFEQTVAATGLSRKQLAAQEEIPWDTVWLHPKNHVGYYPGAQFIHMSLNYRKDDGRVLGVQAVGGEGVARRVDVLAMAIQLGGTVYDLEEAELCYAPQFGAAKDAVNMAGMLAANRLRGDFPSTTWAEVGNHVGPLVDVREPHEFADGHVDNATNLPLSELRDRLDELPRDADVVVYCHSGKRSYDAVRMLAQRGFSARSVLGGMMSKEHHQP